MRLAASKEKTAPLVSTLWSFLTLDSPRNGGRSREPLRTCSNHFSSWAEAGLDFGRDAGALVAEPAGEAVSLRKLSRMDRYPSSVPESSPRSRLTALNW